MSKKKKKRKTSNAEMLQDLISELEMLGKIRDAATMLVDTAQDGRVPPNMVEGLQNMLAVYSSTTAFGFDDGTNDSSACELDRDQAIKLVVWQEHETLQSTEAKAHRRHLESLTDDELAKEVDCTLNEGNHDTTN